MGSCSRAEGSFSSSPRGPFHALIFQVRDKVDPQNMLRQTCSRSSDILYPEVLELTPVLPMEAGCRETYSCEMEAQSLSDLRDRGRAFSI